MSSCSTKSSDSPPCLTVSNRAIWLLLVQDHPQDCILGVHKFISFLRTSPELALYFTVWNDRMDPCLLEIFLSTSKEGGNLVPPLDGTQRRRVTQ